MKKQLLALVPALLLSANVFAGDPTPFLLKWDGSMATPDREGLVVLTPGSAVTLEAGRTNDVFAIFGVPAPEEEKAHRAVSLEFRFRFWRGTNEVARGTIHADQHGVFVPAHHPVKPWDPYRPATQALSSTGHFTVPPDADSLEIERAAVDNLNGISKVGKPLSFAIAGREKTLLVAPGDSRGDDKTSPKPFVLGGPIRGGKPLVTVFDEYRAMNAWVRTEVSKMFGGQIIATYSGADIRTMTCFSKKPSVVYFSAWADLPLFEITTRVRFDEGEWQEFPARKLYPAWGTGKMKDLFPFPFDTVPGLFRAAGPHAPKNTATIFAETATSKLAPLHEVGNITVPAQAKTVSLQTRIHAYLIAHYGKDFEGKAYVGDDCIRIYEDRQRVELQDLWDTPDFTSKSAWTFPVR